MKKITLVVILIMPLLIYFMYNRVKYLNGNKLYTISKSVKTRNIRGRREIEVYIEYDNKLYTVNNTVPKNCIDRAKKGDRFLIEFLKENPTVGIILCDYIISDSILLLENEFWDEIPIELKKND